MPRLHQSLLVLACSVLLWNCFVSGEDTNPPPTRAKQDSTVEVDRLIRQLGSDDFNEREGASKTLEAIGEPAMDALCKAATTSRDVEIRERAEKIVKSLAKLYRELHPSRDTQERFME